MTVVVTFTCACGRAWRANVPLLFGPTEEAGWCYRAVLDLREPDFFGDAKILDMNPAAIRTSPLPDWDRKHLIVTCPKGYCRSSTPREGP